MVFLLIPPIALTCAIAWNAWTSRERKPPSVTEQVENYKRQLEALAPAEPLVPTAIRR